MNQFDLVSKQMQKSPQAPLSPSNRSKEDKRPPNINVSKIIAGNHKWKQCKIIGKNISIRSYSAACSLKDKLYIYGGYQILNGSLHDFYSISLDEAEPIFVWEDIIAKGKVNPGSRSKHALLAGKSKIYMIGGLKSNNMASNEIFQYDPETIEWKNLIPEGSHLPLIQSFSSTIISTETQEKIIIAFGFNEEKAAPTNAIYQYNITKNRLSILFEGCEVDKADIPLARIGTALASDNGNIYFFGGKNQDQRLNDLWSFSLTTFKFNRLKDDGDLPAIRNGHTMSFYDGKLFVFGGIHDITWQLDDLHIYTLKENRWTTLQADSPRKIQKKNNSSVHDQKEKHSSSKKKNWYETQSSNLHKIKQPSSPLKNNFSIGLQDNKHQSPGKMLDQQRRKVFYQKKTEMLKNFQISPTEKGKLLSLQTSSQAMKNSLDVIGNPNPKIKVNEDRLTDFGKESHSKFLEPLQNNSNIVVGKKPCARDGHCSVIIKGDLIIFGGDRHQMSFNDIYKLNLQLAEKDIAHH